MSRLNNTATWLAIQHLTGASPEPIFSLLQDPYDITETSAKEDFRYNDLITSLRYRLNGGSWNVVSTLTPDIIVTIESSGLTTGIAYLWEWEINNVIDNSYDRIFLTNQNWTEITERVGIPFAKFTLTDVAGKVLAKSISSPLLPLWLDNNDIDIDSFVWEQNLDQGDNKVQSISPDSFVNWLDSNGSGFAILTNTLPSIGDLRYYKMINNNEIFISFQSKTTTLYLRSSIHTGQLGFFETSPEPLKLTEVIE